MKVLFDLNSLRPPRSGIGYYTQHLLEGLRKRPDIDAIAGSAGSDVYEDEKLTALMNDDASLGKAAQFSEGLTAAALRAARNLPGVYAARTVVRGIASSGVRGSYGRRGSLNLRRLVDAFARLSTELRDAYPPVLIGADGWMNSELMRDIEPLTRAGQMVTPGYVSRTQLLRLFAAAVFAYPSLYEGFGLPVAEAMASGLPILRSNVTSIPEVVAGAALEVDPYSVDEIAAGLARLLGDASLRATLIERGLAHAAELTWDATVAKTCSVYHAVAG